VPDEPTDHALGRSRGGYGTKVHLVVCCRGTPLAATVTAGQAHESKHLEATLSKAKISRTSRGRPQVRPRNLGGDKGYSYPGVRNYLQRRGIRAVIPRRSDQIDGRSKLDRQLYRGRNIIERCVGWLKENRRLGTRYEKLAVNFDAMVTLGMIRLCLRRIDSSNRA
jgi:transposase